MFGTSRVIMAFFLLPLFGCHFRDQDREAVVEIEQLLERHLKPGDPASAIEEALRRNGLPFSYDRFSHSYLSSVPSSRKTDWKGMERLIQIQIFVNEDGSLKRTEVRMVYGWF